MKIQFLGATRTTTGSMYLLELNQRRVLLECGLYQGRRAESIERNCCFTFDPASVDAAILSHAHIDHCGNFPNLCKQGFRGNIYCTFATRDLASIMLQDSAEIQQGDVDYVNRQRAKMGQPPVEPLYSAADAERATRQFVSIGYDRPILVTDGLTVTFRDAGHILGAAQVVLDVREGGRSFRYLFTGDIGRGGDPILRDPQPVENVDFLQIESTYGNRLHQPRNGPADGVMQPVLETLKRGGKVIIPAFAVGRTQQIVYAFNRARRAEQYPDVPIFVDSPLAVNATEVHRLHPECFNSEVYRFLEEVANPFEMDHLTYIRQVSESKKLNEVKGPAIIISASGMAEAGRILHHLKNNIGDPENLILFVGYCAEHTLGAQILSGKSPVNIFGEPYPVRARVASIDSLSGHADRNELKGHVERLTGDLKKIFVIHGEEEQSLGFAELLRQMKPASEVIVPMPRQVVEV
jgi:metallo-beta-lactamase family protein